MTGEGISEAFWAMLAARLLHPFQVQIIEAMRWIDRPLSASQLVHVFERKQRLSKVAYHLRRLDSLGALRPAGQRYPTRGSVEKFYRLGFEDE